MTSPSSRDTTPATVLRREVLSDHLVRLTLAVHEGPDGPEVTGLTSSGVPDEWLGLVVPGQYQSRYYTVRSLTGGQLVLDVVVHEEGLVTGWAQTDCVGEVARVGRPHGSFDLPEDAGWLVLVGDLTALPAIARICEEADPALPVTAYVECAGGAVPGYLPDRPGQGLTWLEPPADGSGLAELVRGLAWPEGPGYFWMAGESAQMRDIRRHVRHEVGMGTRRHAAMGYWSSSRGRQARAVDPGPIYARGKAEGKSDEEIWADYDAVRTSR